MARYLNNDVDDDDGVVSYLARRLILLHREKADTRLGVTMANASERRHRCQ